MSEIISEQENFFELPKDVFFNPKEERKFLQCVKSMVRTSYEYKEWVKFVKFNVGLDTCSFTGEHSGEVTIELHHHPISMGNIIKIIYDAMSNNTNITVIQSTEIVKSVLDLHKQNKIGYVLLVTTLHEKFHNGFLQIPMEYVNGNWNTLLSDYDVNDDIMEVVNKYTSISIASAATQGWILNRDLHGVLDGVEYR